MMREGMVKNGGENPGRPTRRCFLKAAAAAMSALGGALPIAKTFAGQETPKRSKAGARPLDYEPHWLAREPRRSRIVDVSSATVVQAAMVNPLMLDEMLYQGLSNLTGEKNETKAWRAILGDARKIVLKFNSVGADVVKTNEVLAGVLVANLALNGIEPKDVALVEVPEAVRKETATGAIPEGWGGAITVGDDQMSTRQYLMDADAIINIPLLKTHQIAGMSGCMKNISHAIIRHPARCHEDGCSPYVGQIWAAREVGGKVKLNIVNALRIVIDHGPEARGEDLVDYGGLFLGYDPVALDTVGLGLLEMERRRTGRLGGLNVRYLKAAAEMNLGRWRVSDIERVTIKTSP
jgi:hypothetical protein